MNIKHSNLPRSCTYCIFCKKLNKSKGIAHVKGDQRVTNRQKCTLRLCCQRSLYRKWSGLPRLPCPSKSIIHVVLKVPCNESRNIIQSCTINLNSDCTNLILSYISKFFLISYLFVPTTVCVNR